MPNAPQLKHPLPSFRRLLILCLGLFLASPSSSFAQPAVVLRPSSSSSDIGAQCAVFLDSGRQLGIEAVSAPAFAPRFQANKDNQLNFGYTPAAVWIRYRFVNTASEQKWLMKMDAIDDITVSFAKPGGGFDEVRFGRKVKNPAVLRRLGYYYIPLPARTGETAVYVRFLHDDTISLHLSILDTQTLFTPSVIDLSDGIFLGVMAAMILYNLLLFFLLKDASHLYYSLHIFFMLCLEVIYTGMILDILPSGAAVTVDMVETVVTGLALGFYFLFLRKFLLTRTMMPKLDKVLQVLALVAFAHLPTIFFLPFQVRILTSVITFAAAFAVTVILFVRYVRRRFRPVNFFISAWAVMMTAVIIFILRNLGVLPSYYYTDFSLQVGTSAEAVLLAFGLALRINVLQEEKASAERWGQSNLEKAERVESDYRMLFATAPLGIALFTLDGRYLTVNDAYCRMYERDPGELEGKYYFNLVYPAAREEAERGYWEALVSGPRTGIATFERTNVTRTGRRIIVRYFLNFTAASVGQPAGVLCCVEDITSLKQALDDLRSSVREKELLLKEVHHRVKNNLQIIISLFRLKSRELGDPQFQSFLEATAGRIRAIANVHNRIYLSKDVSRVDAETFIPSTVKQAVSVFHLSDEQYNIVYAIEPIKLSVDIALPLSLIINELITNSLSHGYNGRDPLTVEIRFRAEGDLLCLEVTDTGRGFPEEFPASPFESFGLNLVETLASQLGGTMALATRPRTSIAIRWRSPDEVEGKKTVEERA